MSDFISMSLAKSAVTKVKDVSNKTLGVISIEDYPLIPPETDDSPRIKRLFNDINVKGKTALFTKGTYTVGSLVLLSQKSSFSIVGHKDAIIQRVSGYTGVMFRISECSDFIVKGLHVKTDDGFGTPAKVIGTYNADSKTYNVNSTSGYNSTGSFYVYTQAGIQSVSYTGKTSTSFTGCTNYGVLGGGGLTSPVVTDTDIRPIYSTPLHMIGVSDFDITKCLFTGNYNHAASDMVSIESINTTTDTPLGYKTFTATTPTNNGKIYQNTFKNSGEEAVIFRHGCSNIQVNNNYFENVWGTAVTNKGHSSEVSFNTFINCYLGTEVNGEAEIWTQGHKATVKGNKFYGCNIPVFMQTTGTNLEGAGRFVQTYVVQNNEMYNSKFCAIYGRHGNEAIIENNKIEGVTVAPDLRVPPFGSGNGIYLFNVHNSIINNNTISSCANENLLIDSCQNFKATNNRLQMGGLFTKTTGAFTANSATYTVETTLGYPDNGSFKVYVNGAEQTITYTGKAEKSFTGCTGGDATSLSAGTFVYDVGTKRQAYIVTCSNYEFKDNKIMNGYAAFHTAKEAEVMRNKIINSDSTAGILVTGDIVNSDFIDNKTIFSRKNGMKFDGSGRIHKNINIESNKMLYSSTSSMGGYPAMQVINSSYSTISRNKSFTDLTNKPNFAVELDSTTTNSFALDNIAVGYTASSMVRDANTTTPNTVRSLS